MAAEHFTGVKVDLENFSASYDRFVALKALHSSFQGSVIGVVGHNGAGKSTLIKALLGLLPVEGTMLVNHVQGTFIEQLKPEEDMAFCPETGAVFADISVENYVRLWCRMKHRDANYYRKEGSEFIEMLEITPLFTKLGRELSKGQRRRVQTAIGFLAQPRLFLFDEPFDGLDIQKTSELAELIRQQRTRISFFISSHRMDVMERLCDCIVVLKEGEIVATGKVFDVAEKLCGQSIQITQLERHQELLKLLQQKFPHLLANRLGGNIVISGEDGSERDVVEFLQVNGFESAHVEVLRPSLVEAMNYHLREMARQSKR